MVRGLWLVGDADHSGKLWIMIVDVENYGKLSLICEVCNVTRNSYSHREIGCKLVIYVIEHK
jgi:hypothetical protein